MLPNKREKRKKQSKEKRGVGVSMTAKLSREPTVFRQTKEREEVRMAKSLKGFCLVCRVTKNLKTLNSGRRVKLYPFKGLVKFQ